MDNKISQPWKRVKTHFASVISIVFYFQILNSIPSSRIQLVQDSDREGVEDGKVEKALEVLRKFLEGSADKKTDFLEKIASEVDKRKEEKPEKSDKPKKKLKEYVVRNQSERSEFGIMNITGVVHLRELRFRFDLIF
jgi:hypothetical protein